MSQVEILPVYTIAIRPSVRPSHIRSVTSVRLQTVFAQVHHSSLLNSGVVLKFMCGSQNINRAAARLCNNVLELKRYKIL